MIHRCVCCNKLYIARSKNQKTCSKECQKIRHREVSLNSFYERKAKRSKPQKKVGQETYSELIKRMQNEKKLGGEE